MTEEALLDAESAPVDDDAFPPVWRQGDQRLTLRYRFEPGAEDDGVTVQVPLPLLAGLLPDGFDWQVPGLRHELVTAMIKSLPKAIRRHVVPAADWADPAARRAAGHGRDARPRRRAAGGVPRRHPRGDDQPADQLAGHRGRLRPRPHPGAPAPDVPGDRRARPAARLRQGPRASCRSGCGRAPATRWRASPRRAPRTRIERAGLTTWDLDELPRHLDTEQKGPGGTTNVIRAYPALVDDGASVSIRLMSTPADQARGACRAACAGCCWRASRRRSPTCSSTSPRTRSSTLAASPYPNTKALFDDCLLAVIDSVLYRMKPDGQLFMRAEFEAVRDRVSGDRDGLDVRDGGAGHAHPDRRARRREGDRRRDEPGVPVRAQRRQGQLAGLVYPGFVSATGLEQLRHLPRYLNGITQRIARCRRTRAATARG